MLAFPSMPGAFLATLGALFCAMLLSATCAIGAEPLVNNADGVALHGSDAVSYQQPGGPQKGLETITVKQDGFTYRFANEQNKTAFVAEPQKWLPQYGGWCAHAIASGDFVDVDPKTFTVTDGQVFLFYNGWLGNTLTKWNHAEADLHGKAEANWKKIVTERVPK